MSDTQNNKPIRDQKQRNMMKEIEELTYKLFGLNQD